MVDKLRTGAILLLLTCTGMMVVAVMGLVLVVTAWRLEMKVQGCVRDPRERRGALAFDRGRLDAWPNDRPPHRIPSAADGITR